MDFTCASENSLVRPSSRLAYVHPGELFYDGATGRVLLRRGRQAGAGKHSQLQLYELQLYEEVVPYTGVAAYDEAGTALEPGKEAASRTSNANSAALGNHLRCTHQWVTA